MPTSALVIAPTLLTVRLHRNNNARLPLLSEPVASVHDLDPLNFRRRFARPVSCYALFKGWLPLSQPPGCLSAPTSFAT